MTEKERQDTKMATLYELRLIISNGEKKEYTKEELVEQTEKKEDLNEVQISLLFLVKN